MEKQKKVIDASVILKWFVDEAGKEEALRLREEYLSGKISIVIPDLLFLEVINALRYKNKKEKGLNDVITALNEYQFHTERLSEFLLKSAISISLEYNLTLYDAVYAALAQLHGCQLITADKELGKLPNAVVI